MENLRISQLGYGLCRTDHSWYTLQHICCVSRILLCQRQSQDACLVIQSQTVWAIFNQLEHQASVSYSNEILHAGHDEHQFDNHELYCASSRCDIYQHIHAVCGCVGMALARVS